MPVIVRVQLGAALGEQHDSVPDAPNLRRLMNLAVRATMRHEKIRDAEISVTLLDDEEIADMNREFLDHDGPTDVISFALFEHGETPVGDVYVGYRQAGRQAASEGRPLHEELARLTIHGVLHVLGHDHGPGEERFESPMWIAQETIVTRVLSS